MASPRPLANHWPVCPLQTAEILETSSSVTRYRGHLLAKLLSKHSAESTSRYLGMSSLLSWRFAGSLQRATETRRWGAAPGMSEGRSKRISVAPRVKPSYGSPEGHGPTAGTRSMIERKFGLEDFSRSCRPSRLSRSLRPYCMPGPNCRRCIGESEAAPQKRQKVSAVETGNRKSVLLAERWRPSVARSLCEG